MSLFDLKIWNEYKQFIVFTINLSDFYKFLTTILSQIIPEVRNNHDVYHQKKKKSNVCNFFIKNVHLGNLCLNFIEYYSMQNMLIFPF